MLCICRHGKAVLLLVLLMLLLLVGWEILRGAGSSLPASPDTVSRLARHTDRQGERERERVTHGETSLECSVDGRTRCDCVCGSGSGSASRNRVVCPLAETGLAGATARLADRCADTVDALLDVCWTCFAGQRLCLT